MNFRSNRQRMLWLMVTGLLLGSINAQENSLRIGTVTDGPWDRDQTVLATLKDKVTEALAATHSVSFEAEKQLNGDWGAMGARAALNRLLADPDVDLVVTLGLISSFEAARQSDLPKPVIATRVIAPDLLKIPFKTVGDERVSGVRNLSYITFEGMELPQKMQLYRRIVPFSRVTFLMLESLKELLPRAQAEIATVLAPLNLAEVRVAFVGNSTRSALTALTPEVDAVVLTPLPQLEPAEYSQLLRTLLELGLPTFTLGTKSDVSLGVMAGVTAPGEVELLAERTASNIGRILAGEDAADLPVRLPIKETLSINTSVASALGVSLEGGAAAGAEAADGTESDRVSPSMATVNREEPALRLDPDREAAIRRRELSISKEVQKRIFRISRYTVFDAISFSVKGEKVTLLGYVYRQGLERVLDRTIGKIEGVEVENHIEVLPASISDDRIRTRAYGAVYGHPSLRKYAPGGGLSRFDFQRAVSDLRFGLDAVQQIRGPHPIHIIVRRGHVALVGYVNNRIDRQIAETQVSRILGVFSVENHLEVERGR